MIHRVPAPRAIVGAVATHDVSTAVQRLERLDGALHEIPYRTSSVSTADGTALVVVSEEALNLQLGDVVVWGVPVGRTGTATDAEVEAAVKNPRSDGPLRGSWCLAIAEATGVRLVTSATMVHALKRSDGRAGTAVATRGFAAAALAEAELRLGTDRVPEHVLFDFVFADDELVDGVTLVEEASVTVLTHVGVATESWWPLADRMRQGEATTAGSLRAVVGDVATSLAAGGDVQLGLTAGRDSTLVLSCLMERGQTVPTFTFGPETSLDNRGAAELAACAGVAHRAITSSATGGVQEHDLLRWVAWSEGADPPFNLLFGGVDLGGPPFCWMTGHGGELGRAFYWQWADRDPARQPPADVIVGSGADDLPRRVRATLIERVAEESKRLRQLSGRSGADLIDVFYARDRMRNWLLRNAPYPQTTGFLPVYLEPELVRTLIDIPEESRRSGVLFDEAIALGPLPRPNFSSPRWTLPSRAFRGARWRLPRLAQTREVRALEDMLDAVERRGSVVRPLMGETWWRVERSQTRFNPSARRRLWNALGVELLARWLDETDGGRAPGNVRS